MQNEYSFQAEDTSQALAVSDGDASGDGGKTAIVREEQPPSPPNKYKYPEFAGFAGERYLKSIVRKILPLALFNTWEVLAVDFQAQGNDAYLGVNSLADLRQRTLRKIRLDLAEFRGRQLLAYHTTRKFLQQADGTIKVKTVVVKDFSRLYDLAYEYHLWQHSDCYIEPDREIVDAIKEDGALLRKLIRFDNYRRLLCHDTPGPKPQIKEHYRWYTEYDPEQEVSAHDVHTDALQVKEDDSSRSGTNGKLYLKKELKKELKKASQERINENDYKDSLKEDSFSDSEGTQKGGDGDRGTANVCSHLHACSGGDYKKNESSSPLPNGEKQKTSSPLSPQRKTNASSPLAEKERGRAKQTNRPESAELTPEVRLAKQAMRAAGQGQKRLPESGCASDGKPKPNSHPLVESFVNEVSFLFGDRNRAGSLTGILRVVQAAGFEQDRDILKCLVRAYLVTHMTREVKPEHRHPDGDNKMPLFSTMVSRFVKSWVQGKFHYSDEELKEALDNDERLLTWLHEYQVVYRLHGGGLPDASGVFHDAGSTSSRASEDTEAVQSEEDEVVAPLEEGEAAEEAIPGCQQESLVIVEDAPECGFGSRANAVYWADYLYQYSARNTYLYDVLPTSGGNWGFVFYAVQQPEQVFVYLEVAAVREAIRTRQFL